MIDLSGLITLPTLLAVGVVAVVAYIATGRID